MEPLYLAVDMEVGWFYAKNLWNRFQETTKEIESTVFSTAVGLLVISVMKNGMVLMNLDPFYQDIARGCLLILAVAFDRTSARLSARRAQSWQAA